MAGDAAWRKGCEAVAIATYRQEHGHSPAVNFGRMPAGYRMSSGNNARLVAIGKRFRGGVWAEPDPSHRTGIAPVGALDADPLASNWAGHRWSEWVPMSLVSRYLAGDASGLYRIRDDGKPGLLYIGEGTIKSRLRQHLRKARSLNHPQGAIFADAKQLMASWVRNDAWLDHQRLELETDLIAAHVLTTCRVPPAQFLGEGRKDQVG
jgi:hypothetical protein